MRVMSDAPVCPAAGVTRTVRFEPLPPKVTFAGGTSVVLVEDAESVRLAVRVSTSPIVTGRSPVF